MPAPQHPSPATILRALKGPPISIIMALILYPERSLGPARLASITGYSERSTRTGLTTLAELGLAQRHAHHNGWTATTQLRQLILGEPPTQHTTTSGSLPVITPQREPATIPASQHHAAKFAALPPVVVVVPDPDHDTGTSQQQHHQPANGAASTLANHLQHLGIWTHTARRLARDPWVTTERADHWHRNILDQLDHHPGSIRNPAALLAANLKAHREPPPPPPDPWADLLCPDCHAAPCICSRLVGQDHATNHAPRLKPRGDM